MCILAWCEITLIWAIRIWIFYCVIVIFILCSCHLNTNTGIPNQKISNLVYYHLGRVCCIYIVSRPQMEFLSLFPSLSLSVSLFLLTSHSSAWCTVFGWTGGLDLLQCRVPQHTICTETQGVQLSLRTPPKASLWVFWSTKLLYS